MEVSKNYLNCLKGMKNRIFMLFILMSTISLSDANSDAFAQVFKEASKQGGKNVIERIVNSLYYGLIAIYRGVSMKISQMCGFVLLGLMIISILKIILQNIDKVDVYTIMKMILPTFVKNIIIAFIMITPTSYPVNIGLGNSVMGKGMMEGTVLTRMVEAVFTMFYKLGLIFFNDPKFNNVTPGKIADIFFSTPLNMLQKTLGLTAFFSIFINIGKIILLIVCLWICGKIIAIYISNIFMALMLVTFSTFYLIFLTMEGTAEIGQKGIRIIVIQSVTMFMTVAMMGISYQVLRLIAVDNSIQGIASLAIMLLMLEQVMENISTMATAITTGGTLGASKGDNFMGLMGSFGTMFAGMAMMGGAKYDELKNGGEETGNELFNKENNTKEDNRSSKYSDKEIMAKANRNVENEANGRYSGNSGGNSNSSDNGLGVRYNKGRGVPKNFKKAEDSFRDYKDMKKKSGLGTGSMLGLGAAMFFQAGTMDLSSLKSYTDLASGIKDATGGNKVNNDYPYNVMSRTQQLGEAGAGLFKDGFKGLFNKLGADPVLVPEMGSMNEATKGNAYYGSGSGNNKNRNDYYSDKMPIGGNNYISNIGNTPLLETNSINTYIDNLETMNRNNPNKILSQKFNSPEDIANAIKDYHKKTQ